MLKRSKVIPEQMLSVAKAVFVPKSPAFIAKPLPPLAHWCGLRRMRAGYPKRDALRRQRSLQWACQAQQIIPIGAKAV